MNTGSPLLDLFLTAIAIIFGPFVLLIGGTGMGSDASHDELMASRARKASRKAARKAVLRRAFGKG